MGDVISSESLLKRIFLLRGEKVLLDSDLAQLYGVGTKRLNEQVRRNIKRFPADFMFQLTEDEIEFIRSQIATLEADSIFYKENQQFSNLRSQIVTSNLRSQIATSSLEYGGRRYLPYAFTERGVAMLSSVLNSERAIQVNIEIMRAFVRLREILSSNKELSRKLDQLEKRYDHQFKIVFDAIRELMAPPAAPKKKKIGFGREKE